MAGSGELHGQCCWHKTRATCQTGTGSDGVVTQTEEQNNYRTETLPGNCSLLQPRKQNFIIFTVSDIYNFVFTQSRVYRVSTLE